MAHLAQQCASFATPTIFNYSSSCRENRESRLDSTGAYIAGNKSLEEIINQRLEYQLELLNPMLRVRELENATVAATEPLEARSMLSAHR